MLIHSTKTIELVFRLLNQLLYEPRHRQSIQIIGLKQRLSAQTRFYDALATLLLPMVIWTVILKAIFEPAVSVFSCIFDQT